MPTKEQLIMELRSRDDEFHRGLEEYIEQLQTELDIWKDEYTCEECEKSLTDTTTGVTAFCISCWNAMITKLRSDLSAKDELIFAYDATRSPVIDKTILNLRSDLATKDERIKALEKANGIYWTFLEHDMRVKANETLKADNET